MRYYLIDRITALAPPASATAVKCVSLADDVFVDHFPGHPIMPGALVVEALAQLGGVLLEATMRDRVAVSHGTPSPSGREEGRRHDLHALLVAVDRARFRQPVRPGDKMELACEGVHCTEDGGRVRGTARVDGTLAAEAELTFAFARVTNPKLLARRREVLDIWLKGELDE